MALNPLNGQLWAAERFAIDYVQLRPDLRLLSGDKSKPESYPGFGADIHAVADGTVVGVLDGLPEQVPGQDPTGLPLEQYAAITSSRTSAMATMRFTPTSKPAASKSSWATG